MKIKSGITNDALANPAGNEGRILHVAMNGSDASRGAADAPFRTIQHAAEQAMPGDTVIVHEGVYREWVCPPRGGLSRGQCITFSAAEGERVEIKGSEVISDWKDEGAAVWKAVVPNSLFGDFNPYAELIDGGWFIRKDRDHHRGMVHINGAALFEAESLAGVRNPVPYEEAKYPERSLRTWYAEVELGQTTIWANFGGEDPNKAQVEINVRPSCFYPKEPGINYITVRGFHMSQAAPQWADPIYEQTALIGTHWSKGWVIEDNVISDSRCVGITLGKDAASCANLRIEERGINGTIGQLEVHFAALASGWSREKIGGHIVRRNRIFNCNQAGICGCMGAAFSEVTDNEIFDTWTERQFSGEEMAAIKFHAAIDTLIARNRLSGSKYGLWLDWMSQGTRVSGNLFFDNYTSDLYVEVNHGPFTVDNNLMLSPVSLLTLSQGGLYVHNWFAGSLMQNPATRATPYHLPHSTQIAGVSPINGGDDRFLNNIFSGAGEIETRKETVGAAYGLPAFEQEAHWPVHAAGNLYLQQAMPLSDEQDYRSAPDFDPKCRLEHNEGQWHFRFKVCDMLPDVPTRLVKGDDLGVTVFAQAPFEDVDGKPLCIDRDYSGSIRDAEKPVPGPFECVGQQSCRVPLSGGKSGSGDTPDCRCEQFRGTDCSKVDN